MTLTNKELGIEIRKLLKANGYNTKDISVRVRGSRYDTSVSITVKDLAINMNDVEKLVSDKFERIRYCEASGEILNGCNTYVNVRYDYETLQQAVAAKLDEAEAVWDMVHETCERNSGMRIATNKATGTSAALMLGNNDALNMVVVFKDGESCSSFERGKWNAHNAYALAEAFVIFNLHGKFN